LARSWRFYSLHSSYSRLRPGAGGTAIIIAANTIMGRGTTAGIITAIGIAKPAHSRDAALPQQIDTTEVVWLSVLLGKSAQESREEAQLEAGRYRKIRAVLDRRDNALHRNTPGFLDPTFRGCPDKRLIRAPGGLQRTARLAQLVPARPSVATAVLTMMPNKPQRAAFRR
jgi:hypothetical protein